MKNMKNKFSGTFVAIAMVFVGYDVYQSQRMEMMSELMLANVEALATGESGSSCTASVSCSNNSNDYVSCTGTYSCEREAGLFDPWVKCDGVKTSC